MHQIEDPAATLSRYNIFFNNDVGNVDGDVEMIQSSEHPDLGKTSLSLTDPMTILPIDIPVRGEICQHLNCFDLSTFVTMNAQNKRWKCPSCNKRTSFLKVDSFFKYILDKRKILISEMKGDDFDNKVELDKDLSITFTKN